MANKIQIKRTSVSGRTPNTTNISNSQYIDSGELALNITDKKLFSSNGSASFEVGSNLSLLSVGTISANGSNGSSGQVLTSNGTGVYWDTTAGGITVRSTAGNGGTVNTAVSNVTGINFDTVTGFNVTDQGSGNVFVSLGSGFKTIEVAGQTSITAVGEDTLVIANGDNVILTTSNAAPKTLTINLSSNLVTNAQLSGNLSNYQTTAGLASNVATLTANNTSFVGSVSAANVVSNAQLSGNLANYVTATNLTNNLANYQTTAGLAANVATLTANNTSFVGSVSAANVVSNAQLSANLTNYQTTAGLAANVATLAANSATYVNVGAANQILYRNSSNVLTTSSGLQYDGVSIKVNGNLESTYQNGDEGGEIFLSKPAAANTSIAGTGVTLDIYQNKLRIFENGGNNRGAYIDITAAANGIGSNLLTGGGGGGGTVTSVGSGNGLTGGPITGSGTLSVLANSGIIANSTGVYVNQTYNYTWSNTQTFQANVAFTGNNISVVSNTGSVMFAGGSDSNWRIGRSTGAFTKTYYTNNSLDFVAANSNLEGIAFGFTGSEVYLETGYAGTFTKNPIYVGNSSVNASINSTSFSGTSNNTLYVGTISAANVVSNAQLSGNLANYVTATNLTNNLANYQTTAGLAANVATLTANNTSFVGTVSAANVVSNAQLSANLANYALLSGASFTNNISVANVLTVNVVSANGSNGTSGQVLTSNGTSVYWSTVSAGGFSNGQSISVNNFVITGALTANSSNGTSGQFLTSNGSAVYWSGGANTAATMTNQKYTANGTANTFTLNANTYTNTNILVTLNGLLLTSVDHYTVSGNTLSLIEMPANNDYIEVISISGVGGGSSGSSGITTGKAIAMALVFGG